MTLTETLLAVCAVCSVIGVTFNAIVLHAHFKSVRSKRENDRLRERFDLVPKQEPFMPRTRCAGCNELGYWKDRNDKGEAMCSMCFLQYVRAKTSPTDT